MTKELSAPARAESYAPAAKHAWREPGAVRTVMLMAGITFREAARRKILWIAGIAGVAFLGLFWAGLHAMLRSMSPTVSAVQRHEGVAMMLMMTLYAGSMMTSLMAALTSCDTLAGEIASGTIHAIATKPVRRWALVLGKWAGFVVLLGTYILFIEGGSMLIAWNEGRQLAPHAASVLGLIWLQAILLLGVTMACSTRLSALTSGACTVGLYGFALIGGWIEQFGALRHVRACVDLGIVASLLMPSDALWRRAAFRMQPPLLGAIGVSPFSSATFPSQIMILYAGVYALAALLLAQVLFEHRDL
ncbi:MAG TPA: ABC transporter permease subunit [Acidobacteriaceae bacterium]|nr:ABC transporter permease subunit [Acidobacteriaceae bacterium]